MRIYADVYVREECSDLLVVHTTVDCPLGDLEAIDVNDRKNCPRLCRVDILGPMPRAESRDMRVKKS